MVTTSTRSVRSYNCCIYSRSRATTASVLRTLQTLSPGSILDERYSFVAKALKTEVSPDVMCSHLENFSLLLSCRSYRCSFGSVAIERSL